MESDKSKFQKVFAPFVRLYAWTSCVFAGRDVTHDVMLRYIGGLRCGLTFGVNGPQITTGRFSLHHPPTMSDAPASAEPVEYAAFEASKENIQPLKQGRNPTKLLASLAIQAAKPKESGAFLHILLQFGALHRN